MGNELKRSKRIIIGQEYEEQINPENERYLKLFLQNCEIKGLSQKTIYNYERDLKQYLSYLVREQFNPSVTEVTEDDVSEFIYYCMKQGNNTERIKRRMSPLNMFFKFLKKKKKITENPMEYMDRPKRGLPVVTQTFLTKEQVQQIRDWLDEQNNTMLYTYFELSYNSMGRVNAISNMKWKQFNFDKLCVNDVLEKEGKIVTLRFSKKTKDLLLKLKQEREEKGIDCPYVFISKQNGVWDKVENTTMNAWAHKIGNAIGVPTLHCHDFRHSHATILKNDGMPLESISKLLNHNSTDTTKNFYIKENEDAISEEYFKFVNKE